MNKLFWFFSVIIFISSSNIQAKETDGAAQWVHLFGLSYNFNTTAKFEDARVSSNSGDASLEVEYGIDDGLGIAYEARKVAENSWGIALGAEYISVRKINEVEIKGNGNSGEVKDDDGFTTATVYMHAIYQWERFYIPFGLRYSSLKYQGDGEIKGGLGGSFGFGWELKDKLYLELVGKTSRMAFEEDSESVEIGEGLLSWGSLQVKYNFF